MQDSTSKIPQPSNVKEEESIDLPSDDFNELSTSLIKSEPGEFFPPNDSLLNDGGATLNYSGIVTSISRCKVCGAEFPNKWSLEAHQSEHEEKEDTSSNENRRQISSRGRDECYSRGCSLKGLLDHLPTGKGYECNICGRYFRTKYYLRIHKAGKTYVWKVCKKDFSVQNSLIIYMKRFHSVVKPFKCDQCGECCATKTDIKTHIFFCEELVIPASFQDRSRELSKQKSEDRKGNRKISKYAEIQANDPPRTREIDAKRQKASGKSKTNVLRKDHDSITRPDGNRIRCDDCGRLFESQQNLNQHFEKVHARNGPYECTQCGHLLKTRQGLIQHLKIHGERKHKCILCDKRFLTRNRLNSHVRTHTKERPYACHQCGRKYSSKGYLAVHSKFHSSRKSYECGQCGKKFAIAAYLKQHMRMHTGEKFPCKICGRLLSQRITLLQHMKLHSGVKAYECTHCGKSFALKAYLIAHERTHTGEKPYTCSVCQKKFSQRSAMVQHEKKHVTS